MASGFTVSNESTLDSIDGRLERFAHLVAAAERESFYGQDKPAECVSGCPTNQICDYCQIVAPVREMIAAEREACAVICDNRVLYTGYDCAAAIRSRDVYKMGWPIGDPRDILKLAKPRSQS